MPSSFKENIYHLISNDRLEEVLELLQDGNHWIPEVAKEDMQTIAKEVREVKQQEIRGTISKEKLILQKQKIRSLLTVFVEKHFASDKQNIFRSPFKRIILWIGVRLPKLLK